MSKPAAIVLLVILVLLLFGVGKILLPSIRKYINRMPKGIFVLLFLAIACTVGYLIYYLVTGTTGGTPGNESSNTASIDEENEAKPIKENCIVLSGPSQYIENKTVDDSALESYIDYRVKNNIPVTIVDDYATLELMKKVKGICDKKGVNYSIEDEKWLEKN
ncbi:MAG: hypothetical protein IJL55_01715 [Lachnospiraceae bacterium]|nr:hypothetical protein [Lachnospiraceae bacterium]